MLSPALVFRNYVIDGVPDSGKHDPKKAEIIQMLEVLGSGGAGLVVRNNKPALDAVTPANENAGGWVLSGVDAGYYYRSGGAWVKGRSFPDTLAKLTSVAGTANAVTASVSPGVDPSSVVAFVVTPINTNTGPITLSISGASPRAVLDINSAPLTPGLWPAGRLLTLVDNGTTYQLMSDPDADGAAASAAASAAAAENQRILAEAAAASVAGLNAPFAQGRLSLVSGVSVAESDVVGATSIYYVPSVGPYVPIFNGTLFVSVTVGAQLALALNGNSGHANYQQSGNNFDLFVLFDAGVAKLGTGPRWVAGAVAGTDTTRGTGAGSSEIELFGGQWVNKNSISIRTGSGSGDVVAVPARRATYVGSMRASADGQATDSKAIRWLYNAYNQASRSLYKGDAAASWAYSDGTVFRQANANAQNQVDILLGLSGTLVDVTVQGVCSSTVTAAVQSAVGLDGTTGAAIPAESLTGYNAPSATQPVSVVAGWKGYPGMGRHRLVWLERGGGSGTQTWFGTLTKIQAGISGSAVM